MSSLCITIVSPYLADRTAKLIYVFSAHYWPEPELFKPDRFIDTEEYRWNRDAFVPFSAGARSCVGQKFAQVEIVCTCDLSTLIPYLADFLGDARHPREFDQEVSHMSAFGRCRYARDLAEEAG